MMSADSNDPTLVVMALVERLCQVRPQSVQQPFRELAGWDSLRHAEFIIAMQKELGVRFEPAQISGMDCVQAVLDALATRRSSR